MNFEDKVTRMENGIRGGGIEIDLTGFEYPDGEIYEIITEISEKGRITPRAKTYIDKLPRKDELNEYLDKNLSSNSITQLQVAFGQAKEDKLITGDVTRDFNKKYFSKGDSTYAKGGEKVQEGDRVIITTKSLGKQYEGMTGEVTSRKLLNNKYSIKLENGLTMAFEKGEFKQ